MERAAGRGIKYRLENISVDALRGAAGNAQKLKTPAKNILALLVKKTAPTLDELLNRPNSPAALVLQEMMKEPGHGQNVAPGPATFAVNRVDTAADKYLQRLVQVIGTQRTGLLRETPLLLVK